MIREMIDRLNKMAAGVWGVIDRYLPLWSLLLLVGFLSLALWPLAVAVLR